MKRAGRRVDQQLVQSGEVRVDGAARYVGGGGDLVDTRRRATGAELDRRVEDRFAGAAALRFSSAATDRVVAGHRAYCGAEKVIRYLITGTEKVGAALTTELTTANGNPALAVRLNGELDGIMTFRIDDAHITGVYFVRNPEKLTHIESKTPLTLR
ncbi:hypothetical protein [Nocardia uniformis]|uniref:hypothetical protein n=1 Tax=Nocardia uniformis TaxID=53432 RepID=UPI000833EC9A|nr:hypothetical protein [Nocardia uniformis]